MTKEKKVKQPKIKKAVKAPKQVKTNNKAEVSLFPNDCILHDPCVVYYCSGGGFL